LAADFEPNRSGRIRDPGSSDLKYPPGAFAPAAPVHHFLLPIRQSLLPLCHELIAPIIGGNNMIKTYRSRH
jgi:hypothetical protein